MLYHADDGGPGIQKDKIVVVDLRGSIAGYALLLVDVQLGFCDKIRLVGPGLHRLPQGDGSAVYLGKPSLPVKRRQVPARRCLGDAQLFTELRNTDGLLLFQQL